MGRCVLSRGRHEVYGSDGALRDRSKLSEIHRRFHRPQRGTRFGRCVGRRRHRRERKDPRAILELSDAKFAEVFGIILSYCIIQHTVR
jgi:hypothetical protein